MPPYNPPDPITVYVADRGRHSSLLVPNGEESVLIEYAYGEWKWFALRQNQWYRVGEALLVPSQGTLGRKKHVIDPQTDAWAAVEEIGCKRLQEITVSSAAAAILLATLEARYKEQIETQWYQPAHDLDFVQDDAAYHLLHNCNHAVADWLRAMGCQVRGFTFIADFIVRPTEQETERSFSSP
ncbi:MAG: DUF2459 domain-containing protein [Phycisphaerales bacterium]|nr:DUF2459 domain-containing protein [Phycisphaerales bacterium]